jgi:hypothetical protein
MGEREDMRMGIKKNSSGTKGTYHLAGAVFDWLFRL